MHFCETFQTSRKIHNIVSYEWQLHTDTKCKKIWTLHKKYTSSIVTLTLPLTHVHVRMYGTEWCSRVFRISKCPQKRWHLTLCFGVQFSFLLYFIFLQKPKLKHLLIFSPDVSLGYASGFSFARSYFYSTKNGSQSKIVGMLRWSKQNLR